MSRSQPTIHGAFIMLSVLLAHGDTAAQSSVSNPCIEIVRAAGLPSQGLTDVVLPAPLRAACEANQRLPRDGIDGGATAIGVALQRASTYRPVYLGFADAARGCEGRCELLRRVVASLFMERLLLERFDFFGSEPGADLPPDAVVPLPGFSRASAIESFAQSIALARAARLRPLEVALTRRRDGVVHPVFAGTTCARFPVDASPAAAPPTRRPSALLVYGSGFIDAPLDEAEQTRVVDAVRQSLARLTGLTVIGEAETEVLVREARLGRSLGRETCAVPLATSDALEDALPDTLIFETQLDCEDAGCVIRVFSMAETVIAPPSVERLHGAVRGPAERVGSWIDAATTLGPPPGDHELTSLLLGPGGSNVRRADGFGEGLTASALRTAFEAVVLELASCTPGEGLNFSVVLDVTPSGEVRIVRTDAGRVGASCRDAIFARTRLPRGRGTRRALVGFLLPRPGVVSAPPFRGTEPRGVQFGEFSLSDARLLRGHSDRSRAIEDAIAACDTTRATRTTPLAAALALSVGGNGRITRVRVTTDDALVRRCLERALMTLETMCPTSRRPAEMRYALCSFPP